MTRCSVRHASSSPTIHSWWKQHWTTWTLELGSPGCKSWLCFSLTELLSFCLLSCENEDKHWPRGDVGLEIMHVKYLGYGEWSVNDSYFTQHWHRRWDAKMNKSQSTASPSRSSLSSRRYRLRTANYSTDGNSYDNHSTISLTSLKLLVVVVKGKTNEQKPQKKTSYTEVYNLVPCNFRISSSLWKK